MHIAASYGYTDIIELLLSNGIDVDLISPFNGRSALHCASMNDQIEAAKILIRNGANIELPDYSGVTPLTIFRKGPKVIKLLRRASAQ